VPSSLARYGHRLATLVHHPEKGTGTFNFKGFFLRRELLLGYPFLMPRVPRAPVGNQCYHVLNRGNARKRVFFKDRDYEAFLKALGHAGVEVPMRVLAWCLMPNHFHLVVWTHDDGDLSRWMHWLQNTHVRRYHQHYHSSGHVWQGRFKAFPIQHDDHLLTVLRYVERNPLRAALVERAEEYPWSSLRCVVADGAAPAYWHRGPVPRPAPWVEWVNQALTAEELEAVRMCVARGRPYGQAIWNQSTAARLGLEATLRPRGRPRKQPPFSS
jgi:putative transposase